MVILPDKLLAAFGVQVTPKLDEPQTCPLCKQRSLRIFIDKFLNTTAFVCSSCQLNEDAIGLVAKVYNETISDSVKHFKAGGNLAYTVDKSINNNQLQDYTKQYSSQVNIQQYIATLHRRLSGPLGRTALAGIKELNRNIFSLHPDTGMTGRDTVPDPLHKLGMAKYIKTPFVTFTYRHNGNISGIVTRDCYNITDRQFHAVGVNGIGVYMEDNITGNEAFVAPDELAAAALYCRQRTNGHKNIPVIAMAGKVFPASMRNVSAVYLIHTHQYPLTLADAVEYLDDAATTELGEPPALYVTSAASTTQNIAHLELNYLRDRAVPLVAWTARELVKLYTRYGDTAVIKALQNCRVPRRVEDKLAQHIDKDDSKILTLLQQISNDLAEDRNLPNGKRVTRTISGFVGYNTNAQPVPLSNIMIRPGDCVLTRDGTVNYKCTLYCTDAENNPVEAVIPRKAFRSAKDLKEQLHNIYLKTGENVPVAIYTVAGYDWGDIRDAFNDSHNVVHEITKLGVDNDLNLYLPHTMIRVHDNKIEPYNGLTSFSRDSSSQYAAVQVTDKHELTAFKELWRNPRTDYTAFAAGISHIISQCWLEYMAVRTGSVYRPYHLIYTDLSTQTWEPCLQQLTMMCSGTPYMPTLPTRNTVKQLERLGNDLGGLPYICNIPGMSQDKISTVVQQSPVSLMSLADNITGERISDENNVWFVAVEDMHPRLPGIIPQDLVAELQKELPLALLRCMRNWHNRIGRNWLLDVHPVVQIYQWIAEDLDIMDSSRIHNVCKKYYTAYSYSDARAFLYELRRMFYLGSSPYTPQVKRAGYGVPDKDAVFAVYEDTENNRVYINKNIIRVINQQNRNVTFDEETLTQQLQDADYTTDVTDSHWILDGDVWQTHVVRAVLAITPELRLVG